MELRLKGTLSASIFREGFPCVLIVLMKRANPQIAILEHTSVRAQTYTTCSHVSADLCHQMHRESVMDDGVGGVFDFFPVHFDFCPFPA